MANAKTRTISEKRIRFSDWPRGWKSIIVDIPTGLLAIEIEEGYHKGKFCLKQIPGDWEVKHGLFFVSECIEKGIHLEQNEVVRCR